MASMRTSTEKRPEHILVVEGESATRNVLSGFLAGRGYRALAVGADEAVPRFENSRPGAVILNVAGRTALDVLATFREIDRHVPIVVIADRQLFPILEQSAPSATLIARPFDGRELEAALAAALKHRPALPPGGRRARAPTLEALLLGASDKMAAVRSLIERVADSDVTVLVRGETGTGKELVARGLRWYSMRRDKPFVKVNCAALPADLLESELFGFERGAFTGAVHAKPGKFEAADEGTIFLDEIGEMSATLQAKLLQVLQDGEFSRLGGLAEVHVDVRVVAATNCDLERAVASRRVPRGSLLPHQRGRDHAAAAARTAGRHPAARRALPEDAAGHGAPSGGRRCRRCRRRRSSCSRTTTGRATCASWRTSSSGSSCSATSRRRTR